MIWIAMGIVVGAVIAWWGTMNGETGAVMVSDFSDGAAECEICNGTAVYLCPICGAPITNHSHENDFICATHSFVNPIRQNDGVRINGDGRCGVSMRVIS